MGAGEAEGAAAGDNSANFTYTVPMPKGKTLILLSVAILIFFIAAPASGQQDLGENTKDILDNVSTLDRPEGVKVPKADCGFLGLNCWIPKVDFTHQRNLPIEEQQVREDLSILERIVDFFTRLFNKSSGEQGYSKTYLPKNISDSDATGQGAEGDQDNFNYLGETEKEHTKIKRALLPYRVVVPASDNDISGPDDGDGGGDGDIPPENDTGAPEYALSLVQIAGKSCGWDIPDSRSYGLTSKQAQAFREANVSCLNGHIRTDVYLWFRRSATAFTYLQCVGFVQGVELGTGSSLSGRNAKDYCSGSVPSGYARFTNAGALRPGDAVVYTGGTWGHIATVIEVGSNKAGSWFRLAEANWGRSGSIGKRMDYANNVSCVLRRL